MSTRPLLADPRPQPHIAEPVDESAKLREELRDLREEFEDFKEGVERERNQLGAMLHSLRIIFNAGADSATIPTAEAPGQPISSAAYEAWKRRLSPACAKVIDALLTMPMSATQLKKYCSLGYSTVTAALGTLRANSLLDRAGDRYTLKRL